MMLKRTIPIICMLLFAASFSYSYAIASDPDQTAQRYKKHTVKWYENIEDIAARYSVSVEAIMDLNNLESPKVTRRQVLYIPDKNYVITLKESNEGNNETNENDEDIKDDDDINEDLYTYPQSFKDHIDISLVMPFNARDIESKSNNNWLDFYSGAILALEELKNEGHSVNLNVIDLGDYSNIYEMIRSGVWEDSDIIIGHTVLPEELETFIPHINRKRIPLISPMDQRAERFVSDSPYFFQVPPSGNSQHESMIKKITSLPDSNKVVIFETGSEISNNVVSMLEDLTRYNIAFKTFSYHLLEGRDINNRMKESLLPGDNTIIICSESVAFISDVLRNLNLVKNSDNSIKIDIYAPPMIVDMNNELEHLHNLNVHISRQYYVDNTNPVTKEFNRRYIAYFRTSPTPFSYQGYDIFKFFGSMLVKYGNSFPLYMEEEEARLLQSTMKFIHVPGGGFKNSATRDIVYTRNWSIIVE